jgi:hypothetical protein
MAQSFRHRQAQWRFNGVFGDLFLRGGPAKGGAG